MAAVVILFLSIIDCIALSNLESLLTKQNGLHTFGIKDMRSSAKTFVSKGVIKYDITNQPGPQFVLKAASSATYDWPHQNDVYLQATSRSEIASPSEVAPSTSVGPSASPSHADLSSVHSTVAHSSAAHPSPVHSSPAHSSAAHSSPVHSSPAHSSAAHSSPVHSSPAHSSAAHSSPVHSSPVHSSSVMPSHVSTMAVSSKNSTAVPSTSKVMPSSHSAHSSTPAPSSSPAHSSTPAPSSSSTHSVAPSPSPSPSPSPNTSHSASPTPTPHSSPAPTKSVTPTVSPTASPTSNPNASSPVPSASPTSNPNASSHVSPSPSSSQAPHSSMAPTKPPTPPPTPAPHYTKFDVKDPKTNKSCIMVAGVFHFTVTYQMKSHDKKKPPMGTAKFFIAMTNKTSVTGSCAKSAKNGNSIAMISVASNHATFTWSFSVAKDNTWTTSNMTLNVTTKGNTHFDNASEAYIYSFADKKSSNTKPFTASKGHSYLCNTAEKVKLTNNVQLDVSYLRVQPVESKSGNFNTADECASDKKPAKKDKNNNVVPIAVGCALAGLIVIVLIAYLIGRRKTNRGYQQV